jgi:hypothetical protein
MKTSRMTFVLLIAGILWSAAQPALAQRGSETAVGTVFDPYVTPKAKGETVSGTLAITYVQKDWCCSTADGQTYLPNDENCLDPQTDMYYSFRLVKGKKTYPFSSVLLTATDEENTIDLNNPPICFSSGTERQAEAIVKFINDTVIPIIFQRPPVTGGFNLVWFIKSIENIVEPDFQIRYDDPIGGDTLFCCGPPPYIKDINEFLMLDIELAVPKK